MLHTVVAELLVVEVSSHAGPELATIRSVSPDPKPHLRPATYLTAHSLEDVSRRRALNESSARAVVMVLRLRRCLLAPLGQARSVRWAPIRT